MSIKKKIEEKKMSIKKKIEARLNVEASSKINVLKRMNLKKIKIDKNLGVRDVLGPNAHNSLKEICTVVKKMDISTTVNHAAADLSGNKKGLYKDMKEVVDDVFNILEAIWDYADYSESELTKALMEAVENNQ